VKDLGLRVWEFGVQGMWFRVQGSGFRVHGSRLWAESLGRRASGLG